MARGWAAALALAALATAAIGCGGEPGVAGDATVSVYVSAPLSGAQAAAGKQLCAGAKRGLARSGQAAPLPVTVGVICLDDTGGAGRWRLAAVGENARHAAENSSTVAYIGELDPTATRFSRSILEAAGIGQVSGVSGAAAIRQVLKPIYAAHGEGQLRDAVRESLESRPGA